MDDFSLKPSTNEGYTPPEHCPLCSRYHHQDLHMHPNCTPTRQDCEAFEKAERVRRLERMTAASKKKAGIYGRT